MRSKVHIYGIEETVDRRIDIAIAEDIKRMLGITKDISILFNEEDSSKVRKARGYNGVTANNTTPNARIIIESEEEPEEDLALVRLPEVDNTYDIFRDDDVGFRLQPLKQNRKRTLKFKIKNKSKPFITALKDKLTLMPISWSQEKLHKVEIYINIPKTLRYLIDVIRALKNRIEEKENKLTLIDYINKYSQQGFDIRLTNKEFSYKNDMIYKESLFNILGRISTDLYTIDKDEDDGYWTLEFDYEIWYEKPIMIIAEYPLMVYNYDLPSMFTNCHTYPVEYVPKQGRRGKVWAGLYAVTQYANPPLISKFGHLKVPHMDDYINLTNYDGYLNIAQILLKVSDPYTACNIYNLPVIKFNNTFKRFLSEFYHTATELNQNIFLFELYSNGKKDYRNKITLTPDGDIVSKFPLRRINTYRLGIKVLTDLNKLDKEIYKKFMSYLNKELEDLIKELNSEIIYNPNNKYLPYRQCKEYYVDELGNVVDEEGYICYLDGTRIRDEETGQYIKGSKKLGYFNGDVNKEIFVDSDGNFVGPDGFILDENGNYVLDEKGNPIMTNGVPGYLHPEDYVPNGKELWSDYELERINRDNLKWKTTLVNNLDDSFAYKYLQFFDIDLNGMLFDPSTGRYELTDLNKIMIECEDRHVNAIKTVALHTTTLLRSENGL